MSEAGLGLQILFSIGGGIISFISPCVLPMVPAYLGMMSGYSVPDLTGGGAQRRRLLVVTLMFVAGFTVVFVALGAAATSFGQFLRQNQLVTTRIAGLVVIALGVIVLAMSFRTSGLTAFFARERRFDLRPSRFGAWGPFLMGMAFAFGWTPCIGPILGTILAVSATQETIGQGMTLLTAYSIGLGIPFVLTGLFVARAMDTFAALRRHLRLVMIASGVLLVIFGVLLLTNQVGRIAGFIIDVMDDIPILRNLTAI